MWCRVPITASAALFAAAAVAQGLPADEEVVVTGRGLAQRPGDRAFPIVTIDRDRIAASASDRLEAVLGEVAGVQQFRRSDSRSANPTSQGLSLRGIGGNAASRALLILDGVPQADPFGGWVAFPAYATDRLGLVRVTRGGGSGYFGPGALAGTVELESATPGQLGPGDLSVAYGSRDAVEAQGAATLRRGAGFATLSAAYALGDGFVPTVADQRGAADRRAPYRSASAALRGVIAVGGTTELQTNLAAFTDRRERGTAFTANRSDGLDASVRLVGRGDWGWSLLGYLQARDFASQFAAVPVSRATATATLDQYATPATGIGGRIEVVPPVGAGFDLRLGLDARAVAGETNELYTFVAGTPTRRREAGGRSRTLGAFADGSWERGGLTATLGGRVDHWRIADGRLTEVPLAGGAPLTAARFADRDGTEATGRVGLAWRAVPTLTLRAAGYRGWRLPTLNELYRPFRVGADAVAANAALAPERLRGVDLGFEWRPGAGVSLAATAYRDRLANAVANVTAGRGPGAFPGVGFVAAGGTYRVRRNLDAIVARGVEVDARWAAGPWFAGASWALTDPEVRASGAAAALDGLRPAQTARSIWVVNGGWRQGRALGSVTLRRVSGQFEDDQNLRRLGPATTLDAVVQLPVARTLAVELRAENVGDALVAAGVSAAGVVERATPRTLWLGLRWRP